MSCPAIQMTVDCRNLCAGRALSQTFLNHFMYSHYNMDKVRDFRRRWLKKCQDRPICDSLKGDGAALQKNTTTTNKMNRWFNMSNECVSNTRVWCSIVVNPHFVGIFSSSIWTYLCMIRTAKKLQQKKQSQTNQHIWSAFLVRMRIISWLSSSPSSLSASSSLTPRRERRYSARLRGESKVW